MRVRRRGMERERRFRVGAAMNVEREKLQSGVFFLKGRKTERVSCLRFLFLGKVTV